MGFLRRIPLLSWLLFPLFWLYDRITFRSFYARPLALFSSNVQRPTFLLGSLIFVLVTGLMTYGAVFQAMHWPSLFDAREYRDRLTTSQNVVVNRYYTDQCAPGQEGLVSIRSKIIEHNYLQVNLRYDRWMDDLLVHSHADPEARFLSDIVELRIDDSLYAQVEWMEAKETADNPLGLVAMIDITDLQNGAHKLYVQSKALDHPKYREVRERTMHEVSFLFWKDVR